VEIEIWLMMRDRLVLKDDRKVRWLFDVDRQRNLKKVDSSQASGVEK